LAGAPSAFSVHVEPTPVTTVSVAEGYSGWARRLICHHHFFPSSTKEFLPDTCSG
jgi:hypothetical protein